MKTDLLETSNKYSTQCVSHPCECDSVFNTIPPASEHLALEQGEVTTTSLAATKVHMNIWGNQMSKICSMFHLE